MKWNDGKERAKFEREQTELRVQYLAAGMTEEQIQKMYRFDKSFYNERRREATHTQELDVYTGEDEDNKDNPLVKKFVDSLTRIDKHFESDRYGWIEQIENEKLCKALKALSDADKELLTNYMVSGMSQVEIARAEGVVKVVVCKKIKRIKNFLMNG